jgi:beta-glucosidase
VSSERVESLLSELRTEEKLRLLRGAPDPEGVATGYVPPVDRLGIPALRLVDGPLGVRPGDGSATAFPASISLAASWDPPLARAVGAAIARETRAYGQDVLLAPGVNIARVPQGGRNFEYYGEDPFLTSRLAVEYVEGVQSEGVMATVKHYVANNQETDRYDVSAVVGERALREIYLPAFHAAIEEGDVAAVMTAYNRVNGTHMSDHRRLLTEVLKGEWGFSGFVVSDWWGTESAIGAAHGGFDLEMPGVPFEELPAAEALPDAIDPAAIPFPATLPDMHEGGLFGDPLRKALADGEISEEELDEKASRILRTMARFGLLDGDETGKKREDRSDGELDTSEHRELARRAACEGTVLLKNDGVLPLDEDATVALCGPNADRAKLGGGGSSEVTPFAQVSPLDGLRERADEVTFKRGLAPITEFSLFDAFAPEGKADESDDADPTVDSGSGSGLDLDSKASLDDAVAAAETADCVVVVVEDDTTEGEDRSTLELPGGQDTLIEQVAAAAERTVVVRRTSGPVEMSWVEDIDALLEAWYPGQAEGAALADVLYGDHDPGGRLPVTFGHSAAEYPTASEESFPGVDRETRYDEGVFVGYRYFDREGTDPLFPFGHGLSYAEFEYGDPAIESVGSDHTSSDTGSSPTASSAGFDTDLPVEVTVPVRNVGDRA